MKIDTQYPYDCYVGYLVTNKENRKNICLVHKVTKQRTTVSFARYLMSVHLQRVLNSNEQVDHIDEDKTNDVLTNLQVLSATANMSKHVTMNNKTVKMVELICPTCNNTFNRHLNKTHLQKGGKYTTCSRTCAYIFLTKKLSVEDLVKVGINQVVRYYRR